MWQINKEDWCPSHTRSSNSRDATMTAGTAKRATSGPANRSQDCQKLCKVADMCCERANAKQETKFGSRR